MSWNAVWCSRANGAHYGAHYGGHLPPTAQRIVIVVFGTFAILALLLY